MKTNRIARTAALALALGALAATPAAARPLPADPDGAAQDLRAPDTRDYVQGRGTFNATPSQDLRAPDTRDYAQGRGTFNSPDVVIVKVPQKTAPVADGIDWADAGIGAGTILGLSLVAAGGALVVVQRRHGHVHAQT